jgi:F-type H+-transporting ATPase subunit epsilon
MKYFTITIRSTQQTDDISNVFSFVGEDDSGSFGILAGHARIMTSLVTGLARFKVKNEPWQYLAMPGAILYFVDNKLTLITRRYLKSANYEKLASGLREILLIEEEQLIDMKENILRLEKEMLKRLREITQK